MDSNTYRNEKGSPCLIQFPNFLKYEHMIAHGFTTRRGGVSTGECESLNMGFNRKDLRENVLENYKRVSNALGIHYENMVFSNQVHENRVLIVEPEDRGKGITRENDIVGYDGLMTNHREVALVTFYADCVPVFFLDPVKRVIAVSHSGWRGTVKEIAGVTVQKMINEFGCRSEDIETAIGPSIDSCCFETGPEVAEAFTAALPWSAEHCKPGNGDRWYIHLQGIIKQTLCNYGILEDKIYTSGVCTKCNKDTFFSHRGDEGRTGSMAGILQLK